MVFNDVDGIYTYTFEAEKKDNCLACSQKVHGLTFAETDKLQVIVDFLIENAEYQMKSPGLTANINGKKNAGHCNCNRCFIEGLPKPNFKKPL
ncbi:NEDD8-activating enzyme E1 catalytic subunit like protein [Argiope bruennichi]|uniref:NEDD8-activating enzyme E1 catalytic subunit like protein n=1 Tax=Argiope bruennichi TaxID=94029 RepID=A0A8T0EJ22_ARGBR|nr:NEDD8-activating enzyme E1 catalytic subunit like protein [Argiope bruennichi]